MDLAPLLSIQKKSTVSGLPLFLLAYFCVLKKENGLIVVVASEKDIATLESLFALYKEKVYTFKPPLVHSDSEPHHYTHTAEFLYALTSKESGIFCLPAENVSYKLSSLKKYEESLFSLSLNKKIDLEKLIKDLSQFGFERAEKALECGFFSARGDTVDIFAVGMKSPLRVETEFGIISSLYYFDPKTNKSIESVEEASIPPIHLKERTSFITSYLSALSVIKDITLIDVDPDMIKEILDPLQEGAYKTYKDTLKTLENIELFPINSEAQTSFTASDISPFYLNPDYFTKNLIKNKDYQKIIFTKEHSKAETLLKSNTIPYSKAPLSSLLKILASSDSSLTLVKTPRTHSFLFKGFAEESSKIIVLSDKELFKRKISKKRSKADEVFIASLKEGDYVVHIDHGVGKFIGMTKRAFDDAIKEYFIIEYAKGDKIYLPVEYADKIAKYIGEAAPKINRLHEMSFKNIRKLIKKDAERIAKELVRTQALRESREGISFPMQNQETEFISLFPFTDTPCQKQTWEDIKHDLASENPMDRLVCGDVGFGKTEMALRAAFRVASNKKSVVLLAPTTILAKQHYDTFTKRFKGFGYSIELLSRLKSPKEQKEIVHNLSLGEVDIVIGTHRLLSKDIVIGNLGLIIIDEEQRFGVKAKEKLKMLRSRADILTMTATPIPRTLNMSLSGLKDISMLTTPPEGRIPVATTVSRYNKSLVKDAILKELNSNGQVFYLHNRVQTILAAQRTIQNLIPKARIGIVHGQLDPRQISKTMKAFEERKLDILVCSSIIENGIDLPNVNTLIVADATRFGLGQLYQLRGRIGRGHKKAHAYFLYSTQKVNEMARKRLTALLAATKLGAGFEIAMRDLEIRGAGNILGKEQSGRVKTIGLTHYLRLLNTAIKEIKTGKVEKEIDVSIDLPLNAFIPTDLVDDEDERLKLYQSLAAIDTIKVLDAKKKELLDGIESPEFENLFYVLGLKIHAKNARITGIDSKPFLRPDETPYKRIVITFEKETDYKKAYIVVQKYPFVEVEGNKLKIDLHKLGPQWKERLEEILTLFG
ncbi:transcription-repair coupling factor [Patescibacteria group bacterium]|nr:transcription-repair coupling factor [Patescibacteria group bacterium]